MSFKQILSLWRFIIFFSLTLIFKDGGAQQQASAVAEIMVNFPNSPVEAILPYYEQLTGKKIIRDANLEGNAVSVVSESALTEDEAIQFIDSALLLNGYAIIPVNDTTLKIINFSGGKSIRAQQLPVISSPDLLPKTEQVVNFIMKLDNVSPETAIGTFSQLVDLNEYGAMTALGNNNSLVITESTSVIRMLLSFKDHVDTPPNNVMHNFVKLERADAERVAEIINGIFDGRANSRRVSPDAAAAPTAVGNEGTARTDSDGVGARPETAAYSVEGIEEISIVPYRRTNSILVVAPPPDFDLIRDLILSFDESSDGVNFMKKKLQFVSVLDYMSSFYNALARGTDIEQRGDLLNSGTPADGNFSGAFQPPPPLPISNGNFGPGASSSALARTLLNNPEEVGAPVSYMIGDTLLIGDPQANSLIVSGSPENLDIIQKLIEEIDVQPKQVYLSTIIGQLTIGDDFDYALNALHSLATFQTDSGNELSGAASVFSNQQGLPNLGSLTSPDNFSSSFQTLSLYGRFLWGANNASLDTALRLFARNTKFKILSRPSVYAQSNVKATISSGQRIAIPTSTLTSAGGVNNGFAGSIISNIEFRDVVLKLEVIPLINSDEEVTLKIAQVNDNVVGSQVISGNEIPTLSTQELLTTVTLKNGETMVLGGLITEREDEAVTGIPGIRNIRFLGKVLGSTSKSITREELLIFIQPHIINGVTPNDLERHRNSIIDDGLKFSDPNPPDPDIPIQAIPVVADPDDPGIVHRNAAVPYPYVQVKKVKSRETRTHKYRLRR